MEAPVLKQKKSSIDYVPVVKSPFPVERDKEQKSEIAESRDVELRG